MSIRLTSFNKTVFKKLTIIKILFSLSLPIPSLNNEQNYYHPRPCNLSIITACNQPKEKVVTVKSQKQTVSPNVVDTNQILLSKTYLHAFSDRSKLDTFKLIIRGSSINTGNLQFEIISYKNEKIYNENYKAVDLLGDLDDLSAKESQDTIKSRFGNFFNPDDFYTPAMDRKLDLTDTDYVDLKTQKDISADTTAIGFIYNIVYESSLEIAYSKKQKKTVVCYASD